MLSFASTGVWSYISGVSTQLNTVAAQTVAIGSNGTFVASFNGYGIYVYSGGWTQINSLTTTVLTMSADNTIFGSSFVSAPGIWVYSQGRWTRINTNNATILD